MFAVHPYVSHDFFHPLLTCLINDLLAALLWNARCALAHHTIMAPLPPSSSSSPLPTPRPDWPIPTFSLRIDDLSHPGIKLFFDNVDPVQVMHDATVAIFQWLYVTTAKTPKK